MLNKDIEIKLFIEKKSCDCNQITQVIKQPRSNFDKSAIINKCQSIYAQLFAENICK